MGLVEVQIGCMFCPELIDLLPPTGPMNGIGCLPASDDGIILFYTVNMSGALQDGW